METLPPTVVGATALPPPAPPTPDDGAPPTPTTGDGAPNSPKRMEDGGLEEGMKELLLQCVHVHNVRPLEKS